VHEGAEVRQVVEECLVKTPPCVDIFDGLELGCGGYPQGCEDMIRGAKGAVLKFDPIDLRGGGENPDLSRGYFEAVGGQSGQHSVPVGDGLVIGVSSNLDVIPGNLADTFSDEISQDNC